MDIVSLLTCEYGGRTYKPRSEFPFGGTDLSGTHHPRDL
ncbi:hypothetical protein BN903_231 [Halorubrum sp. AJ67]|nr:hypothetical protein BN903_231 [Halorubrum sp. AJ67]